MEVLTNLIEFYGCTTELASATGALPICIYGKNHVSATATNFKPTSIELVTCYVSFRLQNVLQKYYFDKHFIIVNIVSNVLEITLVKNRLHWFKYILYLCNIVHGIFKVVVVSLLIINELG